MRYNSLLCIAGSLQQINKVHFLCIVHLALWHAVTCKMVPVISNYTKPMCRIKQTTFISSNGMFVQPFIYYYEGIYVPDMCHNSGTL